MKYSSQSRQLRLDIFSSILEKSLDPSNRWYRLANSMPWDKIEQAYNKRPDNRHCGGGNKPARMVVGALIIKHKMNLPDVETIRIISENPYMQYFIGLEMFTSKPVFDPSLFVYIRKRLDVDSFNEMSVALMEEAEEDDPGDGDEHNGNGSNTMGDGGIVVDAQGNPHKGSIKVDATCCDVEVKYPTDLDVLNDARDVSERLIDKLCRLGGCPKPRTYRKQARNQFPGIIKKRRKSKNLVRKGIRQQLGYPGRNIGSITGIISGNNTSLFDLLTKKERQWIGTIIKVYHQQKGMYRDNTHQCPDRIISVFQPHVRPIVRGKSKAKVEFGSKLGAPVVEGYTFIDHFSWDAYNESVDLERHINLYRERFGYLPGACYADRIYMNRENRALLKKYHIRAAGKPPGRPSKEMQTDEYKERAARDMGERNEAEATFGTGKRVYRANDVRAELPDTADAWTAACFLVKNVMKFLEGLLFALFAKSLSDAKKVLESIIFKILYSVRVVA